MSILRLVGGEGTPLNRVPVPLGPGPGRIVRALLEERTGLLLAQCLVLPAPSLPLATGVFPALGQSLVLHPAVLEPHFDLSLGQIQQRGDLYPPRATQILVEMKLLLQLQELRIGVRGPQPP